MKKFWIITETAQAVIATVAEQVAHLACFVIVIHFQLSWLAGSLVDGEIIRAANVTAPMLLFYLCVIVFKGNAVELAPCPLPNAGFTNFLTPALRCFELAVVAMATAPKQFVVANVPRELLNGQRLIAASTSLFGAIAASLAVALTTLFSHRELLSWFLFLAAEAFERCGRFLNLIEQGRLTRIALHLNSIGSSAGARLFQPARAHFVA